MRWYSVNRRYGIWYLIQICEFNRDQQWQSAPKITKYNFNNNTQFIISSFVSLSTCTFIISLLLFSSMAVCIWFVYDHWWWINIITIFNTADIKLITNHNSWTIFVICRPYWSHAAAELTKCDVHFLSHCDVYKVSADLNKYNISVRHKTSNRSI